jgi:hypothetical protein
MEFGLDKRRTLNIRRGKVELEGFETWSGDTVRSKSRCALRLRYVDLVQACIDTRGHHSQHLL